MSEKVQKFTKEVKKEQIEVAVANLASENEFYKVEEGMTLEAFLKEIGMNFDDSIRVNADQVNSDYVLQADDVVMSVTSVKGGRS